MSIKITNFHGYNVQFSPNIQVLGLVGGSNYGLSFGHPGKFQYSERKREYSRDLICRSIYRNCQVICILKCVCNNWAYIQILHNLFAAHVKTLLKIIDAINHLTKK